MLFARPLDLKCENEFGACMYFDIVGRRSHGLGGMVVMSFWFTRVHIAPPLFAFEMPCEGRPALLHDWQQTESIRHE